MDFWVSANQGDYQNHRKSAIRKFVYGHNQFPENKDNHQHSVLPVLCVENPLHAWWRILEPLLTMSMQKEGSKNGNFLSLSIRKIMGMCLNFSPAPWKGWRGGLNSIFLTVPKILCGPPPKSGAGPVEKKRGCQNHGAYWLYWRGGKGRRWGGWERSDNRTRHFVTRLGIASNLANQVLAIRAR